MLSAESKIHLFGLLLDDGLKQGTSKALKGLPLTLLFCLFVKSQVNFLFTYKPFFSMFFRTIETPDFFCFSKFSFLTFYGKYFRMTFFLPRYNVNSKFEYSLQVWRNLGPTYSLSNIAKKYHADKAPIWSVIGPTKDQHYFSSISANYVRPIYHQFGPLMDRHRTNI